jgi:hypothetical protein
MMSNLTFSIAIMVFILKISDFVLKLFCSFIISLMHLSLHHFTTR